MKILITGIDFLIPSILLTDDYAFLIPNFIFEIAINASQMNIDMVQFLITHFADQAENLWNRKKL